MSFAIGYRQLEDQPGAFAELVADYPDHVREVYFAWPGEPSGRDPVAPAQLAAMREELAWIASQGVAMHLLFNASCYGDWALSRELEAHVIEQVQEVGAAVGVQAVTTMSPVVARALRQRFPELDVRASVNMRLGTVQALAYVADYFTSYNVQREYNRDLERLAELRAWAVAHDKGLHLLINSGCLNFCSVQTFHDNAVAHGAGIGQQDNVDAITTLCRQYYADRDHWVNFLRGSWLRPEDLAAHAAAAPGCGYKLATRLHDNPRLVLHVYATGRHYGNLLDLMEPGFSPQFQPWIIDNRRFPEDWFERSCAAARNGYDDAADRAVLDRVLVNLQHLAG